MFKNQDRFLNQMNEKITLVIPTYNEAGNIQELLGQIFLLDLNLSVLIVDDNSPDGTGEIVDDLKETYKKLAVIHRGGKLGLGSAYITGFREALKDKKTELIMSMDADFTHDPKYIPELIKKIEEGYDVVLGSRHIPGGGVNWGILRKSISKGASIFSNFFLDLGVHDVTGALRCYKRAVLDTIPLNEIKSNGFSFMEEMLFYCKKFKFKIGETPIFLFERKKGHSKLSKMEIIKFFFTILRLKFKR